MEFSYLEKLPANFHNATRVWIYPSTRYFTAAETAALQEMAHNFTQNWLSHGQPVKGAAIVLPEGFVILLADETAAEVSGCSTDSSVRLVRDMEKQFGLSLFDRLMLAFWQNGQVTRIPVAALPAKIAGGEIAENTLYFNNQVQNLAELRTQWLVPAGKTWLAKKFPAAV